MIRQEMLNIMDLFTSQPIITFYENMLDNIDLSSISKFKESKYGPKGYSQHALIRSFIVMQCEHFREITSFRTESERYNSRFKNLNLEKASARNMQSVCNLNTLGHICLLTVAIAAILDNKNDSIRSLSQYKRSA